MAVFPNAFFTLFCKLQKHFQFLALARLRESSQPSKKNPNWAFIFQHPILKYSWKKLCFKPQQHLPPSYFVPSSLPLSLYPHICCPWSLEEHLFVGFTVVVWTSTVKPWTWGELGWWEQFNKGETSALAPCPTLGDGFGQAPAAATTSGRASRASQHPGLK